MLGERVDQVVLVREVPVDGADTDAGGARDVVHLRVEALRRHQLPGRLDHELAVAARVGAHRAGEGEGWRSSLVGLMESECKRNPLFRIVRSGSGTRLPIIRSD